MMYLVTQQDVLDRMGVGEVPPQLPAIRSALVAAHLRIAAELDTKFEMSTGNVEVFELNSYRHNGVVPGGYFRLRLKRGFLRALPTVVCGSSLADLAATPQPVDGVQVSSENLVRGYVFVPDTYESKWVKVTYDSGFAAAALDPERVDDDEPVPLELKEAILAYVPAMIEVSSTTASQGKVPGDLYKSSVDHALMVLQPLYRRLNFVYHPVY